MRREDMATQKKAYPRSWYLVAILIALLVGAGAIASGAFAASTAGLPGGKASAPAQAKSGQLAQGAKGAPASNSKPNHPNVCYPPPPGMTAWYTLDETIGTAMLEPTGVY